MKNHFTIKDSVLSLADMKQILADDTKLSLSEDTQLKITRCRDYLDEKIKTSHKPIYGINTGFGSLYSHHIANKDIETLQRNLVISHACGVGGKVSDEIVTLMLFLKIRSLAQGHSGTDLKTVNLLIDLFNNKALPVVYKTGSLGASGDLTPLAHLSLPLIGLGNVTYQGKVYQSDVLLNKIQCSPIRLKAKEGLSLLNGTQFMSAYAVWGLLHAKQLVRLANRIGALSLDAFDGHIEPFKELTHALRPHPGQVTVAKVVYDLLKGSEIIKKGKQHVQDPYSFRCIPQVHGASLDVITFVEKTVLTEINSVTDNPNCFPEEDEIISGGNFHGQQLALAMDFLAIALAELGNISERRTYQLISGTRDLPSYLIANHGLNSGLMITQYVAASLVNQNKIMCTPASIDSIVSSNGQEDHVSMGANAATKLYDIIQNLYHIMAIESIVAIQALHFRRPLKTSPILEQWASSLQEIVPFIQTDRVLHNDIIEMKNFLKKNED